MTAPLIRLSATLFVVCLLPAHGAETVYAYDAAGNIVSEGSGVVSAPVIAKHPSDRLSHVGGSASFSVIATGSGPLTFQWQRNETDISGATGSTLFLESLVSGDFAGYRVVVTNGVAPVTSNAAQLILDADEDSLPDAWEITHFGSIAAQSYAGDADADGVSNSDEYKDGTLPNNAASRYFRLTVQGGAVGVSPQQSRYAPGTTVTLTAQVSQGGLEFVGWTGDATGIANPLQVTMTADKTIRTMTTPRPLDRSYAPTFTRVEDSNLTVNALLRQPDGKVLVAGCFDAINGAARMNVARMNADATLDPSFHGPLFTYTGSGEVVKAIGVQSDGKVIVAGNMRSVNNVVSPPIVRLLADGSLDPTFVAPGIDLDGLGQIFCLLVQPDDKIVIGGDFTTVGGSPRLRVARLQSGGALDASFDTSAGPNEEVSALARQNDGKIVIGGSFNQVGITPRGRVARLTDTGALDASFASGTGFGSTVNALLVDGAGQIVAGGTFHDFDGTSTSAVARLTSAGALENAFLDPELYIGGSAYSLALQPDGKILAVGVYAYDFDVGAAVSVSVTRFASNGLVDRSFSVDAQGYASTAMLDATGNVWLGGPFTTVNAVPQFHLSRVDGSGTVVPSAFPPSVSMRGTVYALVPFRDGRLLVGGYFDLVNGIPQNSVARLMPDGSVDATFQSGVPYISFNTVRCLSLQADGKALIGGFFRGEVPNTYDWVARLNADGSHDPTFQAPARYNGTVYDLTVQPDGKVVIGGDFASYQYSPLKYIARLEATGALDATFSAPLLPTASSVYSVDVASDGRILIGGDFYNVNGTARSGIALLQPGGALDTSFNTGGQPPNGTIYDAWFVDGGIVMGGAFQYTGPTRSDFAVLNLDGTLDPSRNAGGFFDGYVWKVAPRRGGGFLASGGFDHVDGVASPYIAALRESGVADGDSFKDLQTPNSIFRCLHERASRELVVGGSFTLVGGQVRLGLARYVTTNGMTVSPVATVPTGPSFTLGSVVTMTASATATNGQVVAMAFDYSTDGENFERLSEAWSIAPGTWQAVATQTAAGTYYLRATATDSNGNQRMSDVQGPFHVVSEPLITSASLASGLIGEPFSYLATTTTPVGAPLTNFTAANLPAWATFTFQPATNDGLLSGTPNSVGDTNVPLTATNAVGSGNGSVTLRVLETYGHWKTTQFTVSEQADALLSGPDADFDHDGLSNRMEFALRSQPKTPDLTAVPEVAVNTYGASKYLTLTYRRYKWAGQTSFTPEVSGELSTWNSGASFTTEVSRTDNGDGTETVVVRDKVPYSTAQRRFMRLKVQTN